MSNCPICSLPAIPFVSKKDRFGQDYHYVKCTGCGFLFDEDLVLDKNRLEAKTGKVYDQDYFTTIDSGWKLRGDKIIKVVNLVIKMLQLLKGTKINVLDYGAGNGYVTALIKSNGSIFYYDKYEKPTHPGNYTVLEAPKTANLVLAEELVEHLSDINEWGNITALSENVLIVTTEVTDGVDADTLENWVYINPDAGHSCIYSFKALGLLAKKYGFFYFFFPNKLTHIFIKNRFLSRFNVVGLEYFWYSFLKKIMR